MKEVKKEDLAKIFGENRRASKSPKKKDVQLIKEYYSPEDRSFLAGINEKAGGLTPVIEYFDREKLGRAIGSEDKLEGYILPLNMENSKHLVIFSKNQEMFVIEAKESEREYFYDRTVYRDTFLPGDARRSGAEILLNNLKQGPNVYECRVLLRNDSEENSAKFGTILADAQCVSLQLREERDQFKKRALEKRLEKERQEQKKLEDSTEGKIPSISIVREIMEKRGVGIALQEEFLNAEKMTREEVEKDLRKAEIFLEPEEIKDIEKLNILAEGLGPVIKQLDKENLGRRIDIDGQLKGYILPLTKDNTSHLVMLSDNSMCAIEGGGNFLNEYQRLFSPNPVPFGEDTYWSSQGIMYQLNHYEMRNNLHFIAKNDRPESARKFGDLFSQALNASSQLKEEKEALDKISRELRGVILEKEGDRKMNTVDMLFDAFNIDQGKE